MIWFVAGSIALILFLLLGKWFAQADPKALASTGRRLGGVALMAFSAFIGLRGNLALAGPLAIVGWMMFLGRPLGIFGWMGGGASRSSGQSSTVETATIRMTLAHDTGEMDGTVLKGRFSGQRLAGLSFEDLIALLRECRTGDPEAAQLLEAYLDRVHSNAWQAHQNGGTQDGKKSDTSGARSHGDMDVEEAYATLGLEPGASADAVKQAHRRLMKKLHPDQGGSTYLASKINQAKDVLLRMP